MTDELKTMLRDWLTWAEAGAPEHPQFRNYQGLCTNMHRFRYSWLDEMETMLAQEFGEDDDYPFGGKDLYLEEAAREIMHLNPARLAWVRKVITRAESCPRCSGDCSAANPPVIDCPMR